MIDRRALLLSSGLLTKYIMPVQINVPRYGNTQVIADTFSDLRSVSSKRLQDGYSAVVAGALAPADGLGGMYVWHSTSTVADDDQNTLAPANGQPGRWLRIAVGEIGPEGPEGPKGGIGPTGPAGSAMNQSPFVPNIMVALDKFMQQFGAFPEAFDSNIDLHADDLTYDCLPALQAACDFAAAQSQYSGHIGKVILKPGRAYYLRGQLKLKSNVTLDGQAGGLQSLNKPMLVFACDGSIPDGKYAIIGAGDNYAADRVILRGLRIRAISSNTNNRFGGVCLQGFGPQLIECDIDFFGIEGAVLYAGDAYVFNTNVTGMTQPEFAYLGNDPFDPDQSSANYGNRGSLALYGSDGDVRGGEFSGCGRVVNSAKLGLASLKVKAGTMSFYGCRVQTGEVGQREFGLFCRYTAMSWDTNAGHGMVLDGGGQNIFTGCVTGGSSSDGDGLYDHIHNGSDTSLGGAYNTFVNHFFYNGGGHNSAARYDIYDMRNNGGTLSNSYQVAQHAGGITKKVNPGFGGHYISRESRFVGLVGPDGPSILGAKGLICYDNTTFHYFADIMGGQEFVIMGNGQAKMNRFKPGDAPKGTCSFDFLYDLGLDEITLQAGVSYRFLVGNDNELNLVSVTDRGGRAVSIVPATTTTTTTTPTGTTNG